MKEHLYYKIKQLKSNSTQKYIYIYSEMEERLILYIYKQLLEKTLFISKNIY